MLVAQLNIQYLLQISLPFKVFLFCFFSSIAINFQQFLAVQLYRKLKSICDLLWGVGWY